MTEREPWPKPPIAPTLGIDPVAHLARRQPADPSLSPLITIRVQGGARDGEELLLPKSDIEKVLERARRYRARQWRDVDLPELVLRDILVHVNPSPLVMTMPGGWIAVGAVGDAWAGPTWLRVLWHELSDRVRVESPPAPKELPEPPTLAPLRIAMGTAADSRQVVAMPGYVYRYQGRDYSPDEAERMVADLGSVEEWTWRRDRSGPGGCR